MRSVRPEYRDSSPSLVAVAPVAAAANARYFAIPKRKSVAGIDQTIDEVDAVFSKTNDWAMAEPRHFVAFYYRLHERVHGVEPLELKQQREWSAACIDVAMLLTREFGGDVRTLAHFIAWTWSREHKSKARGGTWRTGWRRQFSIALVTDYRIAMKAPQRG